MEMDMERGAGVEPVGEPLQGSGSSRGGQQGVKHLPERWVEAGSVTGLSHRPSFTQLTSYRKAGVEEYLTS